MKGLLERDMGPMNAFQWLEVIGVSVLTAIFALSDKANGPLYLIANSAASVSGITCVALCAGRKKSQYYWGFANILAYSYISWQNSYFGEVMLNMLYYLPLQFAGLREWSKNRADEEGRVKTRRMKPAEAALAACGALAAIWLYMLLLSRIGGKAVWLDSSTTILSLAANMLMVLRYREQWIIWIAVDAITVVMWAVAGDAIMTTTWSFFLINAVYGLIVWSKAESGKEGTGDAEIGERSEKHE